MLFCFYPKKRFINFENFTQKISSISHFKSEIRKISNRFLNQMNRDVKITNIDIFKVYKKNKK